MAEEISRIVDSLFRRMKMNEYRGIADVKRGNL